MRKLMLFVLSAWPALAMAQDDRVLHYNADLIPMIRVAQAAGQISICGLRPDSWSIAVMAKLNNDAAEIANVLWGPGTGAPSGDDANFHLQVASEDLNKAFWAGMGIPPTGCAQIITGPQMGMIDNFLQQ